MTALWQHVVARLDALSRRERLILFFVVLITGAALVDAVWLSPAQLAHRQLTQRLAQQNTELQSLREVVRAAPKPDEANRALREQLAQTQAQLDQVDQQILQRLPGAEAGTPLARVLVHLLRRQEGLALVRTEALPPEAAGPGNSNGTGSLPAGLTRQGVALTVSGPYADLTRFVATLERALPYVRWGSMTLTAEEKQPVLTLQLFLISQATQ